MEIGPGLGALVLSSGYPDTVVPLVGKESGN